EKTQAWGWIHLDACARLLCELGVVVSFGNTRHQIKPVVSTPSFHGSPKGERTCSRQTRESKTPGWCTARENVKGATSAALETSRAGVCMSFARVPFRLSDR
ncbi:unnamed protein product, partial [Ectocarpus fasciculatus]